MDVRIGLLLAACLVVPSISNASVPNTPAGLERTDIGRSPSLGQQDGYNSLIQATTQTIQFPSQSASLKALMDGTPEQRIQTKPNIKDWGRVPLSFEANRGQSASEVKFIARGPGYTVFLTPTETVLSLRQAVSKQHKDQPIKPGMDTLTRVSAHKPTQTVQNEQPDIPAQQAVIRMKLEGANDKPFIEGAEVLAGKVNYFRGNDPAKWHTDIPTYRKVLYKNVYPGIDHAYYGNPSQLEHDFIVAPGADPGVIRIAFEGMAGKADAPALRLTNEGSLALSVPGGEVLMQKPHVYQEVAGQRVEVAASFVLHSPAEGVGLATAQPPSVGFRLASYDQKKPLVIDPVVVYSTYLGGASNDSGSAIAVDSSGNAYVTGTTLSSNFPTVNGKYPNLEVDGDAFVFKLSGDGQTVLYSTYLAGSSYNVGLGIAVDSSGNAYVTGYTGSSNFPTVNAKYPNYGGLSDAFVFKLSGDGQTVLYSTYLGGVQVDIGYGIAVDSSGNAYVTGYTISHNFPTVNAKYPNWGGDIDAFVFKLSGDGQTVLYSTYLGGSLQDFSSGIAVDSSGNAYVTGSTYSSDFPTVKARYPNLGGGSDAFVVKLSGDGQTMLYSTYLGGGFSDSGNGIAVDSSGNAYVTGSTYSSNFPTVKANYPNLASVEDAFVFKLSGDGQTVLYSTYLGGNGNDWANGIAVDSSGNAYVTGYTGSSNFPTVNAKYPNWGGNIDAFVFKLSGDGQTVLYSTYLGGNGNDWANGIAVDSSGNAYVTGHTRSSDFPTVNAKYPNFGGGYNDAFIEKISNQDIGIFGDPSQTAELNGVLDTPVPYVAQPLPDATVIAATDTRKRNVTVLVHGWNSSPVAWANDTKTIIKDRIGQDRLCDTSNANPCWDVLWVDWEISAHTVFPLSAWVAASDVGPAIAKHLGDTYGTRLNHLHLIAHSAGSNVIHHAAKKLEDNKRNGDIAPTSLHMTFLDPYTPANAAGVLSYGNVNNNLIPTFNDSYLTARPSSFLSAINPIAYILMQETKASLLHAYTFMVGSLDANTPSLNPLAWAIQDHAWPYQFYQCSANSGADSFRGIEAEPCPAGYDGVYSFGFPLSQESGYVGSIQSMRSNYRPGWGCSAISPTLCLDFAQGALQVATTVVQTTVHAAQATASATGRTVVWVGNTAYDLGSQAFQGLSNFTVAQIQRISLWTGSPVWVRLPVTISEPANYLRFDFKFTEAAEGYLQVFIHGKRIYSANQRYYAPNTVWKSPDIEIGDLEPGTYEIAFRLDPLSDTQSVVELTNLSLGMLQAVEVANQVPTANAGTNRSVRQGSLVTLDGSASADPDNAPQPMSFSWTLAAGPPTAINNPGDVKPSFTPASVGSYNFNLVVSDGAASSTPAWVTITVPKLGDVDNDGDVDNNDLNQILAARNKPASGPNDLRDLDGNMQIDALDARKLTILCTRPRCATQ